MTMPITAPDRIGIDLGGTKIDAIVMAHDGRVLFEKRVPTPKAYDAILTAIADLVREARARPGLRRRSASARPARLRPGPVCGATPIFSPATASRCRKICRG